MAQIDFEQYMQQLDQAFAVGMREAEVARPPQAPRQYVAQHQPQEVGTRQRACFPLLRLAVTVAEGDLPVVTRENVLLADHAAVQVAAQINEGVRLHFRILRGRAFAAA